MNALLNLLFYGLLCTLAGVGSGWLAGEHGQKWWNNWILLFIGATVLWFLINIFIF